MEFAGRTAIVTGGAQGIGRGIAALLAARGAAVALADLNAAGAEDAAAEIRAAGGRALAVAADVSDFGQVRSLVRRAEAELGPLEILVSNVGWTETTPFLEETEAYWDKVLAVSLKSAILCARAALDAMVPRGRGRIVHIASDAGRVGTMGETVYAAAKGGVIAFTKSLAREVARHGILVNCVSPGPTDTPLLRHQAPKVVEAMTRAIPLKRVARPEDIARAAAFFCSEDAAYITGQVLSVSGGLTMAG